MDIPQTSPMPKKACMVTIMFAVVDDKTAFDIKQQIDAVIKDIPDKRFTFQIIET